MFDNTTKHKSVVLIYSGGLDSTILLHKFLNEDYDIKCISFDYGQKHLIELKSAT